MWPWVKIQIVPPVSIRFNPTTKIGSKMGAELIYQNGTIVMRIEHVSLSEGSPFLDGVEGKPGVEWETKRSTRILWVPYNKTHPCDTGYKVPFLRAAQREQENPSLADSSCQQEVLPSMSEPKASPI